MSGINGCLQVKGVAETVGTRAWQEPELERAAWEIFLKVSCKLLCWAHSTRVKYLQQDIQIGVDVFSSGLDPVEFVTQHLNGTCSLVGHGSVSGRPLRFKLLFSCAPRHILFPLPSWSLLFLLAVV